MARPERVTYLLQQWKHHGDHAAEAELFGVVQHELLKVARATLASNPNYARQIDPQELIAEAYMALRQYHILTTSRAPFFSLMAKAMRHFIIDLAKREQAQKRPKPRMRVGTTFAAKRVATLPNTGAVDFYLALDALGRINQRQADAFELRFMGLDLREIAEETRVSIATVKRDLTDARDFLATQLGLSL